MTDTQDKNSLSEAEKFLESLNLPDAQATEETEKSASDIMSFLDEISNYPTSSEEQEKPTTSATTTTTTTTTTTNNENNNNNNNNNAATPATANQSWSSWGNSFWNQASAAVKTTTDQFNRSVANTDTTKLLENRVKTLQNLVNKENIEKLGTGLKQLTTTLLETVAPPISEHELVQVYLTYQMEGYSGLEALVYRAFARVMEHTESGQVTVRETTKHGQADQRQLHMAQSIKEAFALAETSLQALIQKPVPTEDTKEQVYLPQTGATPVVQCPVYMALQAVQFNITDEPKDAQLMFVLMMMDPNHQLQFKTCSQTMPLSWLDYDDEDAEWVDDKMIDILQMAVTTIAQDYVYTRMSGLNQ